MFPLKKISPHLWEIPSSSKKGMLAPAWIFSSDELIKELDCKVYEQICNAAMLPGIVKHALCMPDAHPGYGFPIGGVVATDIDEGGAISPGGIGYDINCGIRLLTSNLSYKEVKPHLKELINALFLKIPSGISSKGIKRLGKKEFQEILEKGSLWCIQNGYGWEEDLLLTEEKGCIKNTDPSFISKKAIERGYTQMGSLGSGNHYLEIQVVNDIYDKEIAKVFGITMPDQVTIMFHCGSRAFGHQVAVDYLDLFSKIMESEYKIKMPNKELVCAPFYSPEGKKYFSAMQCAMNAAYANRQIILHQIREVFSEIFGRSAKDLGMQMVYDAAHNTAKLEKYEIDGKEHTLLVHRKGAAKALAPKMEGLPRAYQNVGQPAILGGSMESASYLLLGSEKGKKSFFSTAHGSGRKISRAKAKKKWKGSDILKNMKEKGIYIKTHSPQNLAEETGAAYKNIDAVIDATVKSDLSRKVARFQPIANLKG